MHEDKSFLFSVPNLIILGRFKVFFIALTFFNGLQRISIASQAINYLNIGFGGIGLP